MSKLDETRKRNYKIMKNENRHSVYVAIKM